MSFVRWALGDAREQVCLECAEVFRLTALATENAVFEVYDEREIGDAAVVVSMTVKRLLATAGQGQRVEKLGRADLD